MDDDARAEAERIFAEAMQAAQAGRHADAAEKLERVDTLAPGNPAVQWNLGTMRAQLGQHERALAAWEAYRRISPGDPQVIPKVIQACQALGDSARVERKRQELLAVRRAGADPELSASDKYCREQFRVGEKAVVAYEVFEPSGQRRVFYEFFVGTSGGALEGVYSLGSYDTTTEMMRELGNIGADDRLYHLDWYEQNGHATHGFYESFPAYDEIRAAVVAAIEGRATPAGRSTTPAAGAEAPPAGEPAASAPPASPPPGPHPSEAGSSPPPRPAPSPSPTPPDAMRVVTGGSAPKRRLVPQTPWERFTAWIARLLGRGG